MTTADFLHNYIENSKKQYAYYRLLGEKTFSQLNDEQLFYTPHDNSNSIAIIVKHLAGNMASRWTNMFEEDGEKPWRNREGEFLVTDIDSRFQMISLWEKGWALVEDTLNALTIESMDKPIVIRHQVHTPIEAINRQLAHYAYHVGQIVYLGRMQKGDEWVSLSIARGKSAAFNQAKLLQKDKKGHFTDDLLKS